MQVWGRNRGIALRMSQLRSAPHAEFLRPEEEPEGEKEGKGIEKEYLIPQSCYKNLFIKTHRRGVKLI